MLVAGGYPEDYKKGDVISGLTNVDTNSIVFHAGTALSGGDVVTNGGRVMAITSFGDTMDEALNHSFRNAEAISYKGKYYRSDIGKDLEVYYK